MSVVCFHTLVRGEVARREDGAVTFHAGNRTRVNRDGNSDWRALLIDAAGEEAAVDDEGLAGDEGGGVGGEVDGGADQLFGFSEAAHGGAHQEFLAAGRGVEQLGVESVRKTPGAMALTVTPFFDHSTASERVSEATPALLAA